MKTIFRRWNSIKKWNVLESQLELFDSSIFERCGEYLSFVQNLFRIASEIGGILITHWRKSNDRSPIRTTVFFSIRRKTTFFCFLFENLFFVFCLYANFRFQVAHRIVRVSFRKIIELAPDVRCLLCSLFFSWFDTTKSSCFVFSCATVIETKSISNFNFFISSFFYSPWKLMCVQLVYWKKRFFSFLNESIRRLLSVLSVCRTWIFLLRFRLSFSSVFFLNTLDGLCVRVQIYFVVTI